MKISFLICKARATLWHMSLRETPVDSINFLNNWPDKGQDFFEIF